jgi:hypothetical protein
VHTVGSLSSLEEAFIISDVKGALDSIIEPIVEKIDNREVVEKIMNNMIKKLECAAQNNKVGARQPLSAPRKMKFTGRQQKAALRWVIDASPYFSISTPILGNKISK